MLLDVFLAILAAAIAIVGTVWEKPKLPIKVLLITLAVVTGAFAVWKAEDDEESKKFMKNAVISMLRPSNAEYRKINGQIEAYKNSLGFESYECVHNDDGMVCFFYTKSQPSRRATLVLDNSEVARIYGDEIAKEKLPKVAQEVCTKTLTPAAFDEDFKARVAILGRAVVFELFESDSSSTYNDRFGIRVKFDSEGQNRELTFTPDELRSVAPADSCTLFHEIETKYVSKLGASDLLSRFP